MIFVNVTRMMSSFVLVLLIARFLGASGLGTYSFVFSLLAIFQTISRLGLQPLLIREVAKNKEHAGKYFINFSLIGLISSVTMMGVLYLVAAFAEYSSEITNSILIIGVSLIAFTINVMCTSLFIGMSKHIFEFWGVLIATLLKIGFCVLMLIIGQGIIGVLIVLAIAPFINLILNLYFIIRFITKLEFKIDWTECKSVIRLAPTFIASSASRAVGANIIVILLSKMGNIEQVGFYSAAFRIMIAFNLLLQSFRFAIQPQLAEMFKKSQDALQDLTAKSIKYVCTLTIPASLVVSLLSQKIIVLCFSETFMVSVRLLQVVVWSLIPYGIAVVLASVLIVSNNQKIDLRNNVVNLIFKTVIGIFLIYKWGILGAAITHLGGTLLFASLHYAYINRKMFHINFISIAYKIIIASVVTGIVIPVFSELNIFILALLALLVFFLLLIITKAYSRSDIHSLCHAGESSS